MVEHLPAQVTARGNFLSSSTDFWEKTSVIGGRREERKAGRQEYQRSLKGHVSCSLLWDVSMRSIHRPTDLWEYCHSRIPFQGVGTHRAPGAKSTSPPTLLLAFPIQLLCTALSVPQRKRNKKYKLFCHLMEEKEEFLIACLLNCNKVNK